MNPRWSRACNPLPITLEALIFASQMPVSQRGRISAIPASTSGAKSWRINLDGAYLTIRESLRHMPVKDWGRVLAVSSIAGVRGIERGACLQRIKTRCHRDDPRIFPPITRSCPSHLMRYALAMSTLTSLNATRKVSLNARILAKTKPAP